MVSVLAPLRCGGQVSIVGQFSATRFFDQVEQLRPTYFSAVPTIYAVLSALPESVHADISSLRFFVCGAAPVSRELLTRSRERYGFEIVEGYGLTEGTCASACNPVDGVRKIGTVGPALPGQEIRIMGSDGSFLPPGEDGEVVISGPMVMRGYLNKPDATAETIVDGWLHTGDIGHLDADGYLTIVDRLKDMILRGGENIYPKEIEAVLTTVDGVLESAVVGRPDEMYGEVPVAYVSVYPDSTITEKQLFEHCRRHLTRMKVSERIRVVDALPKNSVGKIYKPHPPAEPGHPTSLITTRTGSVLRETSSRGKPCPRKESTVGFKTPDMPPVDPAKFESMPVMDRMRMLATHWAEYGFGGPKQMHALYIMKTVLFVVGGWLVVGLTTSGLSLVDLGGWWGELIVYQKLMVWTVLWEITGHGASWGPWPSSSAR